MSTTAVPIKPIAKSSIAKLWIGLAILVLAAAGAAWAGTRGMGMTTTPTGLRYQVIKAGEGPSPTAADVALVLYEGRLADGTVFDSTELKGPSPLPVTGLIPGFSEGLQLMNKGAKYRFFIPAAIGYGSEGSGPIPPNSDLEFDVTLIDFRSMASLQGPGGPGGPPGAMPPGM